MNKLILTLVLLLSPVLGSSVYGCVCVMMPNPTEQEIQLARHFAFDSAEAVFSGEVVSVTDNTATFRVDRVWKGERAETIVMTVYFKNEGEETAVRTSCDYHFKKGGKYLVYARSEKGALTTQLCSRTTEIKDPKVIKFEFDGLGLIAEPYDIPKRPN